MSRLWYEAPAKQWEEALPLGNGRLGAMVFGGVGQERLQVNEESMWYGGECNRMNPDAAAHLEEVREYIFSGQIGKAQGLLNRAFAACPDSMHPYQTLGDVMLFFEGMGEAQDYERSLDLDAAVSRVSFTDRGTSYRREVFISKPDDCMVVRLTAEGAGKLSFGAKLERGRFYDGVGKLQKDGIYLYGNLGKGGVDFVSGLKAKAVGGSLEVIGQTLCVENAEEVILFFSALTSYGHEEDWLVACISQQERIALLKERLENKLENAMDYPYEQLLERHQKDYKRLYDRVEFALEGIEKYDEVSTDKRLKLAKEGTVDIGLSKLLFDFGRYLLISCSRPGDLPANLQGIWNQDFAPAWDSKYTININAQMNYWPAESCNLSECHLPLFGLLEKMRKSGRKMAREMYGCRGFMAHHNTDVHGDCAPQDTWIPSTYWVLGAAWLCTHVWNHYEYTKDLEFLKKYYPIQCEAALFFLDFLVEKDGYLVTCPTTSPENEYRLPNGESGAVTYGATMDNQILRDLFSQCLAAAEVLKSEDAKVREELQKSLAEIGIEDEAAFLESVQGSMEKLIPNRIGKSGAIMEWVEEYEECEPGHRHISHLYGLHPSNQITVDGTPDLAEAARRTLKKRLACGGGHTGWSRAWIMNYYARLWDEKEAYYNLEQLLAISTYPNMFDRHPPFQIDGNFGAAAAIVEMLVQSAQGRVVLLPALPKAWKDGSIKGIRVRGNAQVELHWKEHRLTSCIIQADSEWKARVMYGEMSRVVSLAAGQELRLDADAFAGA